MDTSSGESLWRVLLDAGVGDAELIEEFKRLAADATWKPLGRVLLEQGGLTMRQLSGLLSMQAGELHMRIGDLAVREGYCTQSQVEDALRLQRESCPGPVELVLRDHRVSDDLLLNGVVKYLHHLEGVIHDLRTKLQERPAIGTAPRTAKG